MGDFMQIYQSQVLKLDATVSTCVMGQPESKPSLRWLCINNNCAIK